MAKFCKYCGSPLEEDELFCSCCGKKIERPAASEQAKPQCPACGAERTPGAKFCKKCGFAFEDSQESQTTGSRRRTILQSGSDVSRITGSDSRGGSENRSRSDAGRQQAAKAASQVKQKLQTAQAKVQKQIGAAGNAGASRAYATSTGSFYIVDFVKNMVRAGNIPSLIYLLLNFLVITLIVCSGTENIALGIIYSIVIYGISVTIALSPIGEFIVRFQSGCRRITDPQVQQRMQPIFQEVYRRAKQQNPSLPDKIEFYMNEDDCPNAFATGRKTVCITKGLLQLPDEHIEAILGHEFGHLSHHDTDMNLVILVGNLFVNMIILFARIIIDIILLIAAFRVETWSGLIMHRIATFMCSWSVNLMIMIWSGIGVLLTRKTSRAAEFEADHFSGELGYAGLLVDALESLDGGAGGRPKGVFAALSATHPATVDRTAKLRADFGV